MYRSNVQLNNNPYNQNPHNLVQTINTNPFLNGAVQAIAGPSRVSQQSVYSYPNSGGSMEFPGSPYASMLMTNPYLNGPVQMGVGQPMAYPQPMYHQQNPTATYNPHAQFPMNTYLQPQHYANNGIAYNPYATVNPAMYQSTVVPAPYGYPGVDPNWILTMNPGMPQHVMTLNPSYAGDYSGNVATVITHEVIKTVVYVPTEEDKAREQLEEYKSLLKSSEEEAYALLTEIGEIENSFETNKSKKISQEEEDKAVLELSELQGRFEAVKRIISKYENEISSSEVSVLLLTTKV